MKNFLTVLTAIALFGLVACEGPAGPAGKDGAAGATGAAGQNAGFVYFEGFKADLKCAQCHNPNDVDTTYRVITKSTQYEMSGHKELGNYDRNTTTCAGCHTNEGFFERSQRGVANETFTINAASGPLTMQAYTSSSPVGCFTCHAPHKRGDFSLRDTVGSVKIFSLVKENTTKAFTGNTNAQLCVKCHQPRMTSQFLIPGTTPTSWQPSNVVGTDTARIYTSRWNNHVSGEGIQTMLGFGGVEFTGNTYTNSYHSTALQNKSLDCADCHMATPVGNKGGGHTFKVGYIPEGSTTLSYNLAGCNTSACHGTSGAITTSGAKWKGVRDEMTGKIRQLAVLMMDSTRVGQWTVKKAGKFNPWITMSVSASGDTSYAANANTGANVLQITPAYKAGALWNLQMAIYEASHGIHNTAYTRSLLDASIAELKK
ncbi:MAG: hypothetical protein ACOYNS_02545 [Bacteroidota bacterium]